MATIAPATTAEARQAAYHAFTAARQAEVELAREWYALQRRKAAFNTKAYRQGIQSQMDTVATEWAEAKAKADQLDAAWEALRQQG